LNIDGNAGAFKVSLQGQTDRTEALTLETFVKLLQQREAVRAA